VSAGLAADGTLVAAGGGVDGWQPAISATVPIVHKLTHRANLGNLAFEKLFRASMELLRILNGGGSSV